jgi:hypothetical protein
MWHMIFVLMLRRQIEEAHNLVFLIRRHIKVAHDVCVNSKGTDCSGS